MARVAFIGAGSVVFTKNLLGDILALPELRDIEIALHDIDPDRLATAEAMARYVARERGASPAISSHIENTGGTRRRRLRDQHGPDRRPRGDAARLRDPCALRAASDHRRHARDRWDLPRAAHGEPHARARARDGGALSFRLVAQLHEPDGDALLAGLRRHADAERRRPLPLGSVHDRGSCGPRRSAGRRGRVSGGGAQSSGIRPPLRTRRRGPLSAPRRPHRVGSRAPAPCAGAALPTARLLPDRVERACRGVLPLVHGATRRRSSGTASRWASTSAGARETSPSTSA